MIEIQGHRGVLSTRHGNTLASFVEALRLGVDAIEVDVWLTSDMQLVLRHDAVIGTADIRLESMLQAVVEKHPATTTDVDLESRPPSLSETLALLRFANATDVVLDIEVKTEGDAWDHYDHRIVTELSKVLKAHQDEQALRIRSFDPQIIRAMSGMLPGVPLVALSRESPGRSVGLYPSDVKDLVSAALATGASAVAPEFGILDAGLVTEAHAAGLNVFPWTLVAGDEICEAVQLGVDGICVNDVALARQVLGELGEPLASSRAIELPLLHTGSVA
jgi:glycerophosphoryl diester phosphodiesterase